MSFSWVIVFTSAISRSTPPRPRSRPPSPPSARSCAQVAMPTDRETGQFRGFRVRDHGQRLPGGRTRRSAQLNGQIARGPAHEGQRGPGAARRAAVAAVAASVAAAVAVAATAAAAAAAVAARRPRRRRSGPLLIAQEREALRAGYPWGPAAPTWPGHPPCISPRSSTSSTPFSALVAEEGYTTPTPIQQQAIGHVLAGRDLLACAQTGTGKTAAFALPILQRLATARPTPMSAAPARGTPRRPIRVLVLTPTRELAAQIGESFSVYGRHLHLRNTVIFGGVGQGNQEKALAASPDILVATPGRLLDLARQGKVRLGEPRGASSSTRPIACSTWASSTTCAA